MRAINHAVTGALIGFVIGEPWVAVPAAVASHYVCDAIPHYDEGQTGKAAWIASRRFLWLLIIDALLCVLLVGMLALAHPLNWFLAAGCAFAATSPDFLNIGLFRQARHRGKLSMGWYGRLNTRLQWFQRPIGAVVEVAWGLGMIILLSSFLH